MDSGSILIIDDNPGLAEVWGFILESAGHRVRVAASGEEALARARECAHHVALVDVHLPDARGTDLLPELKRLRPEMDCVMITAHQSLESAVEAVNRGAYAYLTKPVDSADLLATVERVLERQRLREQNRAMMAEVQAMNHTLNAVIDSVDSGIVLVDAQGEVRFANRRAGEILGTGSEQLTAHDARNLLHDALSPRVADREAFERSLLVGAEAGGTEEMEWDVARPQRCVLRRYCVPIHGDGSPLGRVEVYSDITRQREQLEHERHIAETLQRSILPEIPSSVHGLEVATLYRAALDEARIGGDFYDVFAAGSGCVAVVIGDVSGKGLDAAMQTAMIRYALRSYAFEDPEPASVLSRLNRLAYAQGSSEGFVTLFYGLVDLVSHRFTYVNAGHEVPFLWVPEAEEMRELTSGGPVVGAMPDSDYVQERLSWPSGGTLVLYTDGLSEARRNREFLDAAEVRALLRAHAGSATVHDVVEGVFRDLAQHVGGKFHDDIALMAVRTGW